MQQERETDERDDGELLDELAPQVVDRALDQRRPVVDSDDFHAGRQSRLQLRRDAP